MPYTFWSTFLGSKIVKRPKPFYRKFTKTWYVKIDGKFHRLGADEAEAWEKYHALMLGRQPQPTTLHS